LSRPIIARLRSESHLNERITPRGNHQRLSQQNRHYRAPSLASLRSACWGATDIAGGGMDER